MQLARELNKWSRSPVVAPPRPSGDENRCRAFEKREADDHAARTSGVVASIVLIANIVSFGALMFRGALGDGIPIAIWAMLIGSCVGGVWIALCTSLPPLSASILQPAQRWCR